MHRIREDMRRREEVLERMRRVPAPIPLEAEAEREDVEDDAEPEEAGRDVETHAILDRVGRRECCRGSRAFGYGERFGEHALDGHSRLTRYRRIQCTLPGGARVARLTVQKWWQPLGETQEWELGELRET